MYSVVLPVYTGEHSKMELKHRIGIRVKEIRKARGLSQEELADRTGRSVDAISLLERGKIVPGLDTLDALSKGLGIPLRDLLDFDSKPPRDNEIVALQTFAVDVIRQMNKPTLAVAVKQLDALASLKGR
jgi:transcriptional regulator with XRE-family HTH domain